MTTLLNVALLVIATASTLAAFGGETWSKGEEPLVQRIKPRGWVSLSCLVLALVLGALREWNAKKTLDRANADSARAQADLSSALDQHKKDLALANERLKGVGNELTATQSHLDDMRTNLAATRMDLDRQGNLAFLISLIDSDQRVEATEFYLPLTKAANAATTIPGLLMPNFRSPGCRDLTGVSIDYRTANMERHGFFHHTASDVNHYYDESDEFQQSHEFVIDADEGAVQDTVVEAGQKSTNLRAVVVRSRPLGPRKVTAAEFLSHMQKGRTPLTIRIYPLRRNSEEKTHPYPGECEREVENYLRVAFERAIFDIVLNQSQNLTISFVLKARPPQRIQGKWWLDFVVDSPPRVASSDDFDVLQRMKAGTPLSERQIH